MELVVDQVSTLSTGFDRATGLLTSSDDVGHLDMPKRPVLTYNDKLCARVKVLRERRGWTQRIMAETLGISLENYTKYERRSPLPHWLLLRFCRIMGIGSDDLLSVDDPLPKVNYPKRAS
jgi:DNA-binding XRE family transcriptional regulator